MPELDELGYAVQEKVAAPDFDQILRRGRRRRSRDRALRVIPVTAAGTAAVLAAVAVAPMTLSIDGLEGQGSANEGATQTLHAFAMTAPDDWVASWVDCAPTSCRYTANVRRGRDQSSTTADDDPISALELVGAASPYSPAEPFAVAGTRLAPVLFRLTPSGPVSRQLRRIGQTSTFGPDEMLAEQVGLDHLVVLNVRETTVRPLRLPANLSGGRAPIRDKTRRWWILARSIVDFKGWVAWTDDGGRTWSRRELSHSDANARLAVSPDGRTVVMAGKDNNAPPGAEPTWMSRDRGHTWTPVRNRPSIMEGGPVVFDDGTALVIGRNGAVPEQSAYRIDRSGTATKVEGFPMLRSLAQAGELIYGMTDRNTVQMSTDRGRTWREFEPR